MLHALRNRLGSEIALNKDFKDVPAILLLGNLVYFRFEIDERRQTVKDPVNGV